MTPDPVRAGVTVLCAGNPLVGDDGLGLAVLERLRADWDWPEAVRLEDGGTWGLALLPVIEATDRLLVVDAINVGGAPGDPVILEREEIPRYFHHKLSPHQIDLREVFALCALRGTMPAEVRAIGLQPGRIEWAESLSPAVAAGVAGLASRVVEAVAAWGQRAVPRGAVAHA